MYYLYSFLHFQQKFFPHVIQQASWLTTSPTLFPDTFGLMIHLLEQKAKKSALGLPERYQFLYPIWKIRYIGYHRIFSELDVFHC